MTSGAASGRNPQRNQALASATAAGPNVFPTATAARGAQVTICGRRAEKIKAVAEGIGDACTWVQADINHPADRQKVVQTALEHGNGHLDVLVNNAGNMYAGPLPELDPDDILALFQTNVVSPIALTQLALPHLTATNGSVVFVGSIHAQVVFPEATPYAMTKAALHRLTGMLASELGPQGVRVNCVAPGAVLTEINQRAGRMDDAAAERRNAALAAKHPLGRSGSSEEIAEAIEYLALAEWTTGAILTVDGGLSLTPLES